MSIMFDSKSGSENDTGDQNESDLHFNIDFSLLDDGLSEIILVKILHLPELIFFLLCSKSI